MAHTNREVDASLSALRIRGCHVNREWLQECVNYFRSENNQYTIKELQTFVFDQWILGELGEVAGTGSLPPNLSNVLKTTLQGKMACQVQFVTDIGHSSYTQMQKLRREDVGNLNVDEAGKEFQQAWEPKANRMLQLSLFDGVQTVKAIEYRPIPALKTDLCPGVKVLLQGPILCRRGVLMLEEKHLTILGGEVENLIISNAYENILARQLNLPENPDPFNLTAAGDGLPQGQVENPVQQNDDQIVRQPVPSHRGVNNAGQQRDQGEPRHRQPVTRAPQEQPNRRMVQATLAWSKPTLQPTKAPPPPASETLEFCGSDEDFLNIPLNDMDWESEMEHNNNPNSNEPHLTNVPERSENQPCEFEMGSDEEASLLAAEASLSLNAGNHLKNPKRSETRTTTGLSGEESLSCKRPASSVLPEESLRKPLFAKRRKETSSQEVSSSTDLNFLLDDNFLDFEETSSEASNKQMASVPVVVPSFPFVYLSQIIKSKKDSSKTYRVKAAVITVIEKLAISNGGWKLSAKISDGSASIDVKFSAKVLDELIGMTADDMAEMRKQMAQQPEKKKIVTQKLTQAQGRLINLNSLLDIQMNEDDDLPLVVGLKNVSINSLTALKSRQNKVKP